MSLHDQSDLNVRVCQFENTENTSFETTSNDTTLVLLGSAHDIDAICLSDELLAEVGFSTEEVPSLDRTILAASHRQVVCIRQSHVSDLTRVILEENLGCEVLRVDLPETTFDIIHKPDSVSDHNI